MSHSTSGLIDHNHEQLILTCFLEMSPRYQLTDQISLEFWPAFDCRITLNALEVSAIVSYPAHSSPGEGEMPSSFYCVVIERRSFINRDTHGV